MDTDAHGCLYRRVLGDSFDALPAVLRTFHSAAEGARGEGTFWVRHGDSALARLVARLMRAPAAGENLPVQLSVNVRDGGETWIRRIDGTPIISVQSERGGLLLESFRGAQFRFRLTGDAGGMTFETCGFRMLGIPAPLAVAPRVDARVDAGEDSWVVRVDVSVPLAGRILSYGGRLRPAP